jgi:c(7)-type cytochrome triheme protein
MKKGKTGPFTMAAMGEGKLCGACHDGKTAFTVKDQANCSRCHVKK